jgi:hypothetical protein
MKHALEKAIEALEPLSDEDRALAVRLAGRSGAPVKKAKRKYTRRKALGTGIEGGPEVQSQTAAEAAEKHPERVASGGASAVKKTPVKKGGLAALKSKAKARPLRSAGSGESE